MGTRTMRERVAIPLGGDAGGVDAWRRYAREAHEYVLALQGG